MKGDTALSVLNRGRIGKGGVKDGHFGAGFVAEPVELLEYHQLVDGHFRIVVKLVLGVVLESRP